MRKKLRFGIIRAYISLWPQKIIIIVIFVYCVRMLGDNKPWNESHTHSYIYTFYVGMFDFLNILWDLNYSRESCVVSERFCFSVRLRPMDIFFFLTKTDMNSYVIDGI